LVWAGHCRYPAMNMTEMSLFVATN
jgi:hypothetical protein